MSCPINEENLSQLKLFVEICKANPEILNIDDLKFFKDFIQSFGGRIPLSKPMPKAEKIPDEESPAEEVEVESDESVLEFDMEGCVTPDEITDSQIMGDDEKQPTEEEIDKADEIRTSAMLAFSEGNFEKCIELLTEAIKTNPQSAILFTKRGQAYIKIEKPNACIKDCTHALVLNCDSALAHKFRGRAYRLLGEWEKAAKDLREACNIDMDEQADEWLKEVQPKALRIVQHQLKQERKKLDKDEKERLERLRKAREAHAKAAQENAAEPAAGEAEASSQPGLGEFYKLMQDPEILEAIRDPEVAAAFQDISTNPSNIIKYQSNPKVQALIQKLSSKFATGAGGMGGFPGFGGFPGACGFPGAGGFPPTGSPEDEGLD